MATIEALDFIIKVDELQNTQVVVHTYLNTVLFNQALLAIGVGLKYGNMVRMTADNGFFT